MSDDMRLLDSKRIHDRKDICAGNILAIGFRVRRNVGRRIAASGKGQAAMGTREESHLRLPGPVISGKLVDEQYGGSGPGLLNMQHCPVERGNPRHPLLPAGYLVRPHILSLQANTFAASTNQLSTVRSKISAVRRTVRAC
jgi:hypothetical protein